MSDALVWGIKSSLISYIRGQADGAIDVSDGVQLLPSGVFRFPLVARATGTTEVVQFQGRVRLRAHGGLLDITLADPWIELSSTPSISVVVDWTDAPERVVIARIGAIEATGEGSIGTPVRLTDDGALTLGALQYYEGQQIDDAMFTAPAADA